MPIKDKNITPSVTQKLQSLGYNVADWDDSRSESKLTAEITAVLASASKKSNGRQGFPDRIYVNTHEKLLILVEEKPVVKDHDNPDIEKGAISGVKWYLSRFLNINLSTQLKKVFDNWKILGIAVSGDLSLDYQHKFNCYIISLKEEKIISLNQVTNFMTEEQFLALFNSLDEEKAVAVISSSSKKINNLLRSVDSQKRPVLLSALMIYLHRVRQNSENYTNDFPDHYKTYQPATIITNILDTVKKVLKVEGIPDEKLQTLSTELAFLSTDQTLNSTSILKDILIELETAVIPLFNNQFATNSNYDIIGKFYEEFLKYAGVSNVKKGIVLTPRHITTLFTKLIDLKDNDKIVDICCGTGAFLIAGMNALTNKIGNSSRSDKDDAIKKVKEEQLLGFELNPTMYICAISNMLFRGDGKSSIFNYDSISNPKAQEELNRFQATVGFINPPYSGKENKDDPTPKEITFLVKLLDNCSRYGVIIAPLSTYFKDDNIRTAILERHTLKYVINMPGDLFQPNASTHTAIAVFETHRKFDYANDEITFYDLRDDGFVLAKNKGRTDIYGRWSNIEKQLLNALKPTSVPDDITLVRTNINKKDEWTIYAHSKTDYSTLCEEDFIKSISDYMIFQAKRDLDILDVDLTETELLGAISSYYENNSDE
jgi:type I restriction-modification system DNA methylase subunit